ncbi:MAG: MoaD/ThiS family protein [Saprospiraceae bacterium]|jgi:molybdopterin synthase sulfur carrier subunit|nr:MoaD/ThiS family protein [Saprospiraceae bacterium]
MPTIFIPTPLRKFAGNQSSITVSASSVDKALGALIDLYPDLGKHLKDKDEKIRSFVRIYVGDNDYLDLQGGETTVDETTVISIVPAIAGGISTLNTNSNAKN